MKRLLILLILFAMSACSTKYDISQGESTVDKLSKGYSTYIALPADGDSAGQIHTASGSRVAHSLSEAMIYYTDPVISKATESVANALGSAQYYQCKYLYYVTILNWEPRKAAFSGNPTRVKLDVSVYDVSTRTKVLQRTLEATGRSATVVSQAPEDLLDRLLLEYIDGFYN